MFSKILFQSLRFFTLGLIAIIASIGLIYLADYLLPKTKYIYEGDMLYGVDSSGYAIIKPNSRLRETLLSNGKTLYSEPYTTNNLGMRSNPSPRSKKCTTNHLFLIGASFVFGYGLPDNATLPFHLSQALPCTKVYNFGGLGVGANQRSYALKKLPLKEIPGRGIGIYYFVWTDFYRVMGSLKNMSNWKSLTPCYDLNAEGELVEEGRFIDCRPLSTRLFSFLRYRTLFQKFEWPSINQDDIKLTVKILEEIKNNYLEKASEGQFFVVIHNVEDEHREHFINELKNHQLSYFDLGLQHYPEVPGIYHPNSDGNKLISETLIKHLDNILEEGYPPAKE